MYKFEKSIFIRRNPQEVFDFVTDPANNSKWQSGVESGEWTSEGQVGVGSTQRSVNRFLGRDIEADLEVTKYDPPNEAGVKTISGPVQFEATYMLEPKENGVQLSLSGQAEFGGFFKLAQGMVGKQLEKQMESDLAALKEMMESDQA